MKRKGKIISEVSATIAIILLSNFISIFGLGIPNYKDVIIDGFEADKYEANVGENIYFMINLSATEESLYEVFINFGDQNGKKLNYSEIFNEKFDPLKNESTLVIGHNYKNEGIYQVTLLAISRFGFEYSDSDFLYVEIKNHPPSFNISVTNNIIVNDATYNFENDIPISQYAQTGIAPYGWDDLSSTSCNVRVKRDNSSIYNNVMELSDRGYNGRSYTKNDFSNQSEGVIEFWFRKSFNNPFSVNETPPPAPHNSNSYDTGLYINLKGDDYVTADFRIDEKNDNKIMYYDGNSYKEIGFEIYDDFEWMHIKLEFNCIDDKYDLYFNGFLIGDSLPFRYNISEVNNLVFQTNPYDSSDEDSYMGGFYIDGIGYDWETYSEGDNFALAQSTTYSFAEDETIYLFITDVNDYFPQTKDMQILWDLGNSFQKQGSMGVAYKWEETAIYNVSVTLIDNLNALKSESIEVDISNIKPSALFKHSVDTPSSYGFNRDVPGESPVGWETHKGEDFIPSNWFTDYNVPIEMICEEPKVVEWIEGNYKAIEFSDESDLDFSGMEYYGANKEMGIPVAFYGSFEFWFYTTDASKGFKVYGGYKHSNDLLSPFWRNTYGWDNDELLPTVIENDGHDIDGFNVRIKDNIVQYTQYSGGYEGKWDYNNFTGLENIESNNWYHIKIDFNTESHRFYEGLEQNQLRVYVNNQPSNVITWQPDHSSIRFLGFMTDLYNSDYQCYIDSIGFSWDPYYEVGDNWEVYSNSYKGTYDFRFDSPGEFPSDYKDMPWLEYNDQNCSSEIITELDGHFNILNLTDNNELGSIEIYNFLNINPPSFGTIEFWFRSDDVSQKFTFSLGPFLFGKGVKIRTNDSKWEYLDKISNSWLKIPNISSPENDTWQHIRIDFECGEVPLNGGYLELSEDTFFVTIDNVLENRSSQLSLVNNLGAMNVFGLESDIAGNNYSVYLDAIGYSWDNSYNVGNNLELEKGFYDKSAIIFTASGVSDTPSDHPSLKYFWLFGDNKTGYGRGTIHEYENSGEYNVTLIILDDNGEFDKYTKQITVDNRPPEVHILPPFHQATFNFENDIIGEMPNDWNNGVFTGWINPENSIIIEEEFEGHRNVLTLEPVSGFTAASTGELPLIGEFENYMDFWAIEDQASYEDFFNSTEANPLNQSFGSIEFYLYTDNLSNMFSVVISQTIFTFPLFFFYFLPDGIWLTTSNGSWASSTISLNNSAEFPQNLFQDTTEFTELPLMKEDEWNHIRIDWCCDNSSYMNLAEDRFKMILNGIKSNAYPMNVINYSEVLIELGAEPSDVEQMGDIPFLPPTLDSINILNFVGFLNNTENKIYMDAIGFSWDPDYELGDNLKDPYEINEGDTFLYETTSYDGLSDYTRLEYYWGLSDEFGIGEFENGGWEWTYTWFDDDYIDQSLVYVIDTEGFFDADYSFNKVKINNVDPSVSIYSAYIPTNITLDLWTNKPNKAANFTLEILADGNTIIYDELVKPSGDQFLTSIPIHFGFELSKNYEIIINQTFRQDPTERYRIEATITFDFLYEQGTINSMSFLRKFKKRNWNNTWILNPDQWWVDEDKFILDHPIRFYGSVFDPSNDVILLDVDYGVEWLYEINTTSKYSSFYKTETTKYTFEEDEIGFRPAGWDSSPDVSVVDNGDDYGNVVKIDNALGHNMSFFYQFFKDGIKRNGTIEFDINLAKIPSESPQMTIIFAYSPGGPLIGSPFSTPPNTSVGLTIFNSSWILWGVNSSGDVEMYNLSSAYEDQWHHIKFEFEYTDSGYKNLEIGTCRVTIDNLYSASSYMANYVNTSHHYINWFSFLTLTNDTNFQVFLDNIEYSWFDYTYERILVGSGEATYDFSEDELNTLPQGWDDSYLWPDYPFNFSENMVLVAEELDRHEMVVTLQHKTKYTNTSYNFNSDITGSYPQGWGFYDNVSVVDTMDGLYKVVMLNDTSNMSSSGLTQHYMEGREKGVIELDIYISKVFPDNYTAFIEMHSISYELSFGLYIINNSWFLTGADEQNQTSLINITTAQSNKWYHIRLEFDFTDSGLVEKGTCRVLIDNTYSGSTYMVNYVNSTDHFVYSIGIRTYDRTFDYQVYLDNIEFSWLDPEDYTLFEDMSLIRNEFEDQEYGTVEFWLRSSLIANETYSFIFTLFGWNGTHYTGLTNFIFNHYWGWLIAADNNYSYVPVPFFQDQWFHFRIDFEFTESNYTGLNLNQGRFSINNRSVVVFDYNNITGVYQKSVNNFAVTTAPNIHQDFNVSINDVGYSWDPEYTVGDNFVYYEPDFYNREFILNDITYNVEIYKFDNIHHAKVTLLKDTYDHLYENNDFPVDIEFQFDIMPFTNTTEDIFNILVSKIGLEDLTIIKRLGTKDFLKIIASDDDGGRDEKFFYFNTDATRPTFSFENEYIGKDGLALDFVEKIKNDGNCTIEVVNDKERGENVLKIEDNDSTEKIAIWNYFPEQTSGEISFWWKVTDTYKHTTFHIKSDGTNGILIKIAKSLFKYRFNNKTYSLDLTAENNTWYHHRFVFRINATGEDVYDWYINDTLVLENQTFTNDVPYINNIKLNSHGKDNDGYTSFIDDVNYSWTPDLSLGFENFSPFILTSKSTLSATEDAVVIFGVETLDLNRDNVTVIYNFGDLSDPEVAFYDLNASYYEIEHIYKNPGSYLVTITADDGLTQSKTAFIIDVKNMQPHAHIIGMRNATEDMILNLDSRLGDSPSDMNDLRYYWDFGDGTFSYEERPSHSWSNAGTYDIKLFVRDDNNFIHNSTETITVVDDPPYIEGPFIFYALEGDVIVLDVTVFDSYIDTMTGLTYFWELYGPSGELMMTFDDIKPSFILNDGNYFVKLLVSEQNGQSSSANITLIVKNLIPTVFVASEIYYGNATTSLSWEPTDPWLDVRKGLEITVYCVDKYIDSGLLKFEGNYWIENESFTLVPKMSSGQSCSFYIPIENSTIINGKIRVSEPFANNEDFFEREFQIFAFIDSNGNGYTDEFEDMMDVTSEDQDNDGLANYWEWDNFGVVNGEFNDYDNDSLADWLDWDSDNDGMPDGYMANYSVGEIFLGTNPLDFDTDDDILGDMFEWIGWEISFQRDIGEGFITINTSSNPLVIDTDGDTLDDYDEFMNGTNPNNVDTDFDGVNDNIEWENNFDPNNYDSDGDGLTDGEELYGFIIRTEWGIIRTNGTNRDTDGDGLTDYQEAFGINLLHATNPTLNDTDGDRLLDSQETFTMKKSLGAKRALIIGWNTFEIEKFPDIEKAYSATLTTSVSLGEDPIKQPGKLEYNVELNGKIIHEGSGNNTRYDINIIDIKEIVEESTGNGYGGNWKLNIWVNYECILDEFAVEVSGYLNPLMTDTDTDGISDYIEITPEENRGWSTNPFLKDTDNDGWIDRYEIYDRGLNEMTNPLLWDTDGDGTADPYDLDPRRDCLVEVKIITAGADEDQIYDDYGGKIDEFDRLKVGIVLGADFDYQGVYTGSKGTRPSGNVWVKDFNTAYYFDIDDNKQAFYLNKIMLFGQLKGYHSRGWYPCDIPGSDSAKRFNFNDVNAFKSVRYGSSSNYFVDLEYRIVTIERAHTIAIFENGSYSETWGRYYNVEKMAVIQLNVNSEPSSSSPFVLGANTILIPTSVFTNSKLNSIIQIIGDANQSVFENEVPSCLKAVTGEIKFQGIDRDDMSTQMSAWIEILITKNDCSPEVAQEILNLTLTSIINETTGEEGILYLYDSNSTHIAELMNLPYDILKIVPLFSPYKNGETGSAPRLAERLVKRNFGEVKKDFKWWELADWVEALGDWWDSLVDWFEDLVEAFVKLISDLIVFVFEVIAEFFLQLTSLVIEVGLALVKVIIAVTMVLLELLIKAILLVLIYAIFAIFIFALTVAIGALALLLIPIALLTNGMIIYQINKLEADILGYSISLGYSVIFEYNSFLDVDIPLIETYYSVNEEEILKFVNGFFPIKFEVTESTSQLMLGEGSNKYTSMQKSSNNSTPQTLTSLSSDYYNLTITSPEKWQHIKKFEPTGLFHTVNLTIEWEGVEPLVGFYYYEVKRASDNYHIDSELELVANGVWSEGHETTFQIEKGGFYQLSVQAHNNTDLIDEEIVKFQLYSIFDFHGGLGDSLGLVAGLLPFIDASSFTDESKMGYEIAFTIISTAVFLWVTFLYPPNLEYLLGFIEGLLIAFITVGASALLNKAYSAGGGAINVFVESNILTLLGILGAIGDSLVVALFYIPGLADTSSIINDIASYDLLGLHLFIIAMVADLIISTTAPKNKFFMSHAMLSIVCLGFVFVPLIYMINRYESVLQWYKS